MIHRWRSIVGLTNPRTSEVVITCSCGHASTAPRFMAALAAHDAHRLAPDPPPPVGKERP